MKNFYTDSDGIIWATGEDGMKELLCFPRLWRSDRYQVHGIIRINELAFISTEVSYLWANWSAENNSSKDKFTFSGTLLSDVYQPPFPRNKTVYAIRPGQLPIYDFFPEDNAWHFITTVGRTYTKIMNDADSPVDDIEDWADDIEEPQEYDNTAWVDDDDFD